MAISKLIDKITNAIDNKEHVNGLFWDFYTVKHSIILRKSAHCGIRGNMPQLITNYLSNRQQRVKFNGIDSSLKGNNNKALAKMLFLCVYTKFNIV